MRSFEAAKSIVQTLYNKGFTAYFAGGWVRDYILGHPSNDIDIATNATPEELMQIFPRTILVGARFGIIIIIQNGYHFEVATFRNDENYIDGRRPQSVTYSTAKEDALRRDFTINGMFYDPLNEEVLDYVGGKKDLELGVIRTIGEANARFNEDRLRLIRAVRFACKFHFKIEKATELAIQNNASTLFPSVSIERVWQELVKMSKESSFDIAVQELHRLKLLQVIFKDLEDTSLEEISNKVKALQDYPIESPTILRLMVLFDNYTLDQALELGKYLKITNKELKLLEFFWRTKGLLDKKIPSISLWEWAHFYSHEASELCMEVYAAHMPAEARHHFLKEHGRQRHKLHTNIERIKFKTPLVTPAFLLKEKVPPGPNMGKLLTLAEQISVNEGLHVAEEILHRLKRSSLWTLSE